MQPAQGRDMIVEIGLFRTDPARLAEFEPVATACS